MSCTEQIIVVLSDDELPYFNSKIITIDTNNICLDNLSYTDPLKCYPKSRKYSTLNFKFYFYK